MLSNITHRFGKRNTIFRAVEFLIIAHSAPRVFTADRQWRGVQSGEEKQIFQKVPNSDKSAPEMPHF